MSLLGDIGSFAVGGPIGYGVYKAATSGGSTDVAQVPLMDPAQEQARNNLLNFSKTGTIGNYTAGTPYNGSLGDFGVSALENAGLGQVGQRLTAGPSTLNASGTNSLLDLLNTEKFNPLNNKGLVSGLTGAIDYNTNLAENAAKRSAGYTGNLYSTDAVRNLGNVQAQGANTKATTLAGLYSQYMGQKLGAIPQAFTADAQTQDQARANTADAFAYGGVPRTLNTARDQAAYSEFQRQQQEKQGQVAAATSLSGSNVPFGVPNVSVPNANPWMQVMSLLAQFGGKAAGAAIAA